MACNCIPSFPSQLPTSHRLPLKETLILKVLPATCTIHKSQLNKKILIIKTITEQNPAWTNFNLSNSSQWQEKFVWAPSLDKDRASRQQRQIRQSERLWQGQMSGINLAKEHPCFPQVCFVNWIDQARNIASNIRARDGVKWSLLVVVSWFTLVEPLARLFSPLGSFHSFCKWTERAWQRPQNLSKCNGGWRNSDVGGGKERRNEASSSHVKSEERASVLLRVRASVCLVLLSREAHE